LQEGQRDLILYPKLDFMNTTKVSMLSQQSAMPRFKSSLIVNSGKQAQGWFMDFKL